MKPYDIIEMKKVIISKPHSSLFLMRTPDIVQKILDVSSGEKNGIIFIEGLVQNSINLEESKYVFSDYLNDLYFLDSFIADWLDNGNKLIYDNYQNIESLDSVFRTNTMKLLKSLPEIECNRRRIKKV